MKHIFDSIFNNICKKLKKQNLPPFLLKYDEYKFINRGKSFFNHCSRARLVRI